MCFSFTVVLHLVVFGVVCGDRDIAWCWSVGLFLYFYNLNYAFLEAVSLTLIYSQIVCGSVLLHFVLELCTWSAHTFSKCNRYPPSPVRDHTKRASVFPFLGNFSHPTGCAPQKLWFLLDHLYLSIYLLLHLSTSSYKLWYCFNVLFWTRSGTFQYFDYHRLSTYGQERYTCISPEHILLERSSSSAFGMQDCSFELE